MNKNKTQTDFTNQYLLANNILRWILRPARIQKSACHMTHWNMCKELNKCVVYQIIDICANIWIDFETFFCWYNNKYLWQNKKTDKWQIHRYINRHKQSYNSKQRNMTKTFGLLLFCNSWANTFGHCPVPQLYGDFLQLKTNLHYLLKIKP